MTGKRAEELLRGRAGAERLRAEEANHLSANAVFLGGVIVHVEESVVFLPMLEGEIGFLRVVVGIAELREGVALALVEVGEEQEDFLAVAHLFLDTFEPCAGFGHGVDDFQSCVH